MSTLVRWNPIRETRNLMNEFDRLFDVPVRWQSPTAWGLAIDVAENENGYVVKASVPGVAPEDVEITMEDNVLTLKGELKGDETIENDKYHVRERRFGSFSRSITFPMLVNADAVEAMYDKGVLSLNIPKAEVVKPRRINIKANATNEQPN